MLGMRSVNPQAQLRVIWLGTWFDHARERDAAMTLFHQDADVLAFHTGSNAVMVAAQERGRMAVAYHCEMRSVAPQAQIIAVTHEWGDYYTRRARAVRDGTWTSGTVWGGVKEGMVRVGDFGPQAAPSRTGRSCRWTGWSKGCWGSCPGHEAAFACCARFRRSDRRCHRASIPVRIPVRYQRARYGSANRLAPDFRAGRSCASHRMPSCSSPFAAVGLAGYCRPRELRSQPRRLTWAGRPGGVRSLPRRPIPEPAWHRSRARVPL